MIYGLRFWGTVSFCWPSAGSSPLLRAGCWEHRVGSDKSPVLLTRPLGGNLASAVKVTAPRALGISKRRPECDALKEIRKGHVCLSVPLSYFAASIALP